MMQYKGYHAQIDFDADAGIFQGEVVGIRDVITFHGRSVEEVQQAFADSVEDYLAFCKERGEPPSEADVKQRLFTLESEGCMVTIAKRLEK